MQVKCEIYKNVSGQNGQFVTYIVEAEPSDMVLDILETIYREFDPDLGYRYACGIARCGECAMVINGEPCMACDKLAEPYLRIEPLRHLPIVKDTVIDRRRIFDHIKSILPPAEDLDGLPECLYTLDEQTASVKIENSIRLTTCYECLICQSKCPRYLSQSDDFPGPFGLLLYAQMLENPAQNPVEQSWTDWVTANCLHCGKCVRYCPADRNPLRYALQLLGCEPPKTVRVSASASGVPYVQEVSFDE